MLQQMISVFSPEKAVEYVTMDNLPELAGLLLDMKPSRRAQILIFLPNELRKHLLELEEIRKSRYDLEFDMRQIKAFDEEEGVSEARPREFTDKEEQIVTSMNWSQFGELCTAVEGLSGHWKNLKLLSDGFNETTQSKKDITTNENIVEDDEDGRTQSSEEPHGHTKGEVQTQDEEEKSQIQNVKDEEVKAASTPELSGRARRRRRV